MDDKRQLAKIVFATVLLIAGILINIFFPHKEFFGYSSVGIYLVVCGMLVLTLALLRGFVLKPKSHDERMLLVSLKATRITFVIFVLSAFILMIVDGLKPITLPYSIFLSYFVCFIILCNVITYYILLKYY
jgi:uncharacterized membrane protein